MTSIDIAQKSAYNSLMTSAEDIKKWIKETGISRTELGEKVFATKRTVDGWLSAGKPIPPAKLELIERLMGGGEDINLPLPDDFEDYIRAKAESLKQSIDEFVLNILKKASRKAPRESTKGKNDNPLKGSKPLNAVLDSIAENTPKNYAGKVIGNIAAGNLTAGDTIPYDIEIYRPLEKDEYILRVEGHSMEPEIEDCALVIMRKYTTPPVPPIGTIVQYHDERGVTLKKLGIRDVDGKPEYVLHATNPNFPDIDPMDGGKISAVFVEKLEDYKEV